MSAKGEAMTADWRRVGVRVVVPVACLGVCFWLLEQQISAGLWREVPRSLGTVAWQNWLAAAALTAISLWSVGRYDGVAHRHLQTGIPIGQARKSGTLAVAIAQTLGFGLFTGALVRWRLLPGLSLQSALGLSAFVSCSFIIGWALVTAFVCLLLPAPNWTFWPALGVAITAPLAAFALFRWPELRLWKLNLRMPSLQMTGAILFWSIVDMITAAGALWILLPEEAELPFSAFLALYMLALGTALVSNTPGGVGPFELVLIGAMPSLHADDILLSIIAFRLVYYALPACLAALALVRSFPDHMQRAAPSLSARILRQASRSEAAVILQNGGRLARTRDGYAAFWPTGQTVTALFDPIRGSIGATMQVLCQTSRDTGRLPLLYKIGARQASAARMTGWSVLHLADDALIDTAGYTSDIPARRTLRRKMRAAEKAGITFAPLGTLSPASLAAVDADWCQRNGPARGGTMGRFCPDYLATQRVFVARRNGEIVAFASFFASNTEWALDLMRQTVDAPDGTMHSLVHQAILAARSEGVGLLSLAATPACPDPGSRIWRWLSMQVVARAGGPGLRQFKSAFAPRWVPRYAAAPGPLRLAIGLADVAREVHTPRPVLRPNSDDIHDLHENYELASRKRA